MNNSVFEKTMENERRHRDIRLSASNKFRNYPVSEPTCHIIKWFSENLLAVKMDKTKVKLNKLVYLYLSSADICETLI